MKTDSVVNLAALAALCGTAGIAGYYNQNRKKERDADKIREVLDTIKEQQVLNALKEQQELNKEANIMLIKQANFQKEADLRTALMRLVGASGNAASGIRNAGNSFIGALKKLVSGGASAGSSAIGALKNALGRAGSAIGTAKSNLGKRIFNFGENMSASARTGRDALAKASKKARSNTVADVQRRLLDSTQGRAADTYDKQKVIMDKANRIGNDYYDVVDTLKNGLGRHHFNATEDIGNKLSLLGLKLSGA